MCNSSLRMKDFKYKAKFSSTILACSHLESEDWIPWNISKASLDSLQGLMPKGIDLNKNIDLLGVAFNAAVVNRFNRNGDGINTATALQIKDYFVNKPANIEHQRQKVVGHVVGSSFSGFKTNNLLSDEEIEHLSGPFNIALAAVVYKTVNPGFAAALEGEEKNKFNKEISASWEIGFSDFAIALGSKNLSEAEIIRDSSKIKDFEKYLRAEGGEGVTDDGVEVYRLVQGEVYPLGIGFTTNPAADVEGVHVIEDPSHEILPTMKRQEKSKQNISHLNKSTVNTENYRITMEQEKLIQKLEEILDDKLEKKEYAKETVASIAGVISEAIRVKSDQYVQEKKELDHEKERLAKAEEEFKSSTQALQEQLRVTEEKVETLEGEKNEREAKARFNSRMAAIDEEYELDDADRQIIASEISVLAEDEEAFGQIKEKFSVVWKTKSKAYIEEYNQKLEAQIEEEVGKRLESLAEAQASTPPQSFEPSESVEDVLENAEIEETTVVTNNSAEASRRDETLAEKFRSVFNKENVNIKY